MFQALSISVIWKLYNMGFVVKSKNHTIGFDIFPSMVGNVEIISLADDLDILFLSHAHSDHVYPPLVEAMVKAGKKVVMPAHSQEKLMSMCRMNNKPDNFVLLYNNPKEPVDIGRVAVRCFAGAQGLSLPCNVYTATFDGLTISQNGDNTELRPYQDMALYAGKVDVELANCWSDLLAYIQPIKPALVIPGHENEVSHGVVNRNSYLWLFQLLNSDGNPCPAIVMNVGEHIRYPDCLKSEDKKSP